MLVYNWFGWFPVPKSNALPEAVFGCSNINIRKKEFKREFRSYYWLLNLVFSLSCIENVSIAMAKTARRSVASDPSSPHFKAHYRLPNGHHQPSSLAHNPYSTQRPTGYSPISNNNNLNSSSHNASADGGLPHRAVHNMWVDAFVCPWISLELY